MGERLSNSKELGTAEPSVKDSGAFSETDDR